MASVDAFVAFLLDQGELEREPMTPLKLQKLLYYAQGYTLAFLPLEAFDEPLLHWRYGPVVRSVYSRFRHLKDVPIGRRADAVAPSLDPAHRRLLLGVWDRYGGYSGPELMHRTHRERPWRETAPDDEIPKELMADHFRRIALDTWSGPTARREVYAPRDDFYANPAWWGLVVADGRVVHMVDDHERILLTLREPQPESGPHDVDHWVS